MLLISVRKKNFKYNAPCLLLPFKFSLITMLISHHTTLFFPKDKLFIVPVCAQSLQSYLILCGPMGSNILGTTVHGSFWQEYWGGLPFPSPGHLPDPEIKTMSLVSPGFKASSLP